MAALTIEEVRTSYEKAKEFAFSLKLKFIDGQFTKNDLIQHLKVDRLSADNIVEGLKKNGIILVSKVNAGRFQINLSEKDMMIEQLRAYKLRAETEIEYYNLLSKVIQEEIDISKMKIIKE